MAVEPPPSYWDGLVGVAPADVVAALRQQWDSRTTAFRATRLGASVEAATALLERLTADGWLREETRRHCPVCEAPAEAALEVCPSCGEAFEDHGGVVIETVYLRDLPPARVVDWVVAIHGMNTTGAWQEAFSWKLATTWGRSVPVAVYKYGIVIVGVVLVWRRRKFQRDLRHKLAVLRDQASERGYSGRPDVVAHSFGTWLLGHLLLDELARPEQERLRFGRIILAGCVLRPDFDWGELKKADLVQDVMNHYATKDPIVPLAHAVIRDAGPSGRRGFDGDQVLNVRAEGLGHSDLFSTKHLDHTYGMYWKRFLTVPREEFHTIPDRADPEKRWRQLWWPLRGTVFPFMVLPLLAAVLVLTVAGLGHLLWQAIDVPLVAIAGTGGAVLLFVLLGASLFWRQLRPG